jgi:hypothetical protein
VHPTAVRHVPLSARPTKAAGPRECRAKFLKYFPGAFFDPKYLAWERDYKAAAHARWSMELSAGTLARTRGLRELAHRAVAIESRTNLLFSFEKMALRDAVKSDRGARSFVSALREVLHGSGNLSRRFDRWCNALAGLPRRQTRVLTWPVATVFPFLAEPGKHFFLKPRVTQRAFAAYGLPFDYVSKPGGAAYAHLLSLVAEVRRDLADLEPRDQIDLQSFLWVLGSDEYP